MDENAGQTSERGTHERDLSGRRESPFLGLALPYAIKVKFEAADDISRFSIFRVSACNTSTRCSSLNRFYLSLLNVPQEL